MSTPKPFHVLVIGAGSTGSAIAHDLALRGLSVTVVERGEAASGTTGRNHCLLHSGARYCVTDPATARECIEENRILQRITPGILEKNGGLFVALEEEGLAFKERLLAGCAECGIPARELSPKRTQALEPRLSAGILASVLVPDGAFEPYRLCLAFLATAKKNGATLRTFSEVRELVRNGHSVGGATVWNARNGATETIPADLVINAAGPWTGRIAAMADAAVPVAPTAGVLVTVAERLTRRVINRMHKPAEGDVLVPLRRTTIVGTTSWPVAEADSIAIPEDDVRRMISCGERLVPEFRTVPVRGIMAAARPLLARPGIAEHGGNRGFECIDHSVEGAENLITVIGGKTTTARAMAERAADLACARLGVRAECRTRETTLEDWRLV